MDREIQAEEHTVLPQWSRAMEWAARAIGLSFHPVLVRGWLEGNMFLACVKALGAEILPVPGFDGWVLVSDEDCRTDKLKAIMPEFTANGMLVGDFQGILEVSLDGQRFLALRTEERVNQYAVRPALVLGGPSLEATLAFAARVKAAETDLIRKLWQVRVYGSSLSVPQRDSINEADLILPPAFKSDLLAYLDRFWRAAKICADLRVAPSRGVLFVGAPGTGKTQTIRHLLGRYPQCQFSVFMPPPPGSHVQPETAFETMLSHIAADGRPAVVVIEDIDRLFEEGRMTPQIFLNAVDGLFQGDQPILWVATSNDPSDIAPNILDRPGRFDRIFVFELPGIEERLALLKRFSPWPADPELLEEVARESDGLSGAHLKEVCLAAALASAEEPQTYGAALMPELRRLQEQHDRAERYDFGLGEHRPAGFARSLEVARVAGAPAKSERESGP